MKEIKGHWGRRLCLILIFILLMCSLPIQSVAEHREYDEDKFDRQALIPTLALGDIEQMVTGYLYNGQPFRGNNIIRVINPRK